jgi:LysM repeat protein
MWIGLALVVAPAAAQSYETHVVQYGETLGKIAQQYCTSWQEIYNMNYQAIGPDPNNLIVGTVLTVIDHCGAPQPQPQPDPGGVYDRGPRTGATGAVRDGLYYVAWGDNIYDIAARFGVTPDALIAANGLQQPYVEPGQTLVIPGLTPSQPQPIGGPQRVQFAIGATTAVLNGALRPGGYQSYILQAMQGQNMTVSVSGNGPLPIVIKDPSGNVIASSGPVSPGYSQASVILPVSGDYTVTVGPASTPTSYSIVFDIR